MRQTSILIENCVPGDSITGMGKVISVQRYNGAQNRVLLTTTTLGTVRRLKGTRLKVNRPKYNRSTVK
jgi:hypothetical protein